MFHKYCCTFEEYHENKKPEFYPTIDQNLYVLGFGHWNQFEKWSNIFYRDYRFSSNDKSKFFGIRTGLYIS
jgi:hypothetical protein